MNTTSPDRIRQDCRLIRQTLLRLATPRLVLRAVVIIVAAAIWLYGAGQITDFGKTINYGALQPLGQQSIDLLNRLNPYLWWGVAAIWFLIVFFIVRSWLRGNIEAARARVVPADTFADLVPQLSEDVVDVVRWCWGSRDEPFTVGDLQRVLSETRHGRIDKIAMVREQEAMLGLPPLPGTGPGPLRAQAPVLDDRLPRVGARDYRDVGRQDPGLDDRPAPTRGVHVEPRIGPSK
ncbi:hypothetical protein [Bordetella sp. N]|uniref:hypothetical protein n=1 Tax=Bordetella sp. N TaxID=1746199 RepID=UPI00070EEC46|nr:hypothetical protein [Bordetella sp. N]ALM85532.1 hypothetical protein ASB57_23475 [Bordetella sp. N]